MTISPKADTHQLKPQDGAPKVAECVGLGGRIKSDQPAEYSGMCTPEPDHVKARDWLPEAMNFPAIDPDDVRELSDQEAELKEAA